jgi:hypothetical protein
MNRRGSEHNFVAPEQPSRQEESLISSTSDFAHDTDDDRGDSKDDDSKTDFPRDTPKRSQYEQAITNSFADFESDEKDIPAEFRKTTETLRPSRDIADELRMSFQNRKAKQDDKRQQIVSRIRQRRESQGLLTEQPPPQAKLPPIRYKLDTETSEQPLTFNNSSHSGGDVSFGILKTSDHKRRRATTQLVDFNFSQSSINSFDVGELNKPFEQKTEPKKNEKKKRLLKGSLLAEFSDKYSYDELKQPKERRRPPSVESASPPTEIRVSREDIAEIDGDVNVYKIETRLIKEKKSLKKDVSVSRKKVATLSGDIEIHRSETDDLREQLSEPLHKRNRISKVQDQERGQFDESTDLIAQARVDLSKSLNETRMLKARIADYEDTVLEKDRRSHSLNETINMQSERADNVVSKMKDMEAELRYTSEEKRRLEDELAVLVASMYGQDVSQAIRQLKKEKSQWLDEREKGLEAKRMALDEENDRILELERERAKHNDYLTEASQKSRERERDQKRLQEKINKQLEHMNSAIYAAEIKEKEQMVAELQEEVSELRKELAAKAEVDSAKDDLKNARKRNKILKKEMRSLKTEMEELREKADDWKELIRGVTYASERSSESKGSSKYTKQKMDKKKAKEKSEIAVKKKSTKTKVDKEKKAKRKPKSVDEKRVERKKSSRKENTKKSKKNKKDKKKSSKEDSKEKVDENRESKRKKESRKENDAKESKQSKESKETKKNKKDKKKSSKNDSNEKVDENRKSKRKKESRKENDAKESKQSKESKKDKKDKKKKKSNADSKEEVDEHRESKRKKKSRKENDDKESKHSKESKKDKKSKKKKKKKSNEGSMHGSKVALMLEDGIHGNKARSMVLQ